MERELVKFTAKVGAIGSLVTAGALGAVHILVALHLLVACDRLPHRSGPVGDPNLPEAPSGPVEPNVPDWVTECPKYFHCPVFEPIVCGQCPKSECPTQCSGCQEIEVEKCSCEHEERVELGNGYFNLIRNQCQCWTEKEEVCFAGEAQL